MFILYSIKKLNTKDEILKTTSLNNIYVVQQDREYGNKSMIFYRIYGLTKYLSKLLTMIDKSPISKSILIRKLLIVDQ